MVHQGSIMAMIVQVIIGIALILFLLLYYKRTLQISFRAVGAGIVVFLVFSQVLEQLLHAYMFSGNRTTAQWLANPWLMAVYGGLAAGIFENAGRWVGFSLLLRKRQERKDGIAFGIGHGGMEVLLIGVLLGIVGIVLATMMNAGVFEQSFGTEATSEQIALFQALKDKMLQTTQVEYWLGAFERIPAISIQMALSLIVLYGVRTRKIVYLLYAVLIHACIDFFAGLYQAEMLPLWFVEVIVWAWGLAAIFLVGRSKVWFAR
ncbi:YhfC family intramembrane metalloprotease [Paenibacillus sp. GCM10023248]|uniref:YhfC family intramembrane metalloprotease n=1 Tax=Bacillales TaxID=1385 RepID=UPI002378577D|nr:MULTISPECIES: YhfC family glutamic-type intramembrane protease [Bacillales]MDD9269221.1 YhfC family glutamic-type intramembrane protease [Paenibacillus sp. MAHUQ-63]MDR6880558.1 putative membrane protein YhfC [Bacillus sp. 3255]